MTACKIFNIHIMTKYIFTISFLVQLNSEDPLKLLRTNLKAYKQYDKPWMAYMFKFVEISGLGHISNQASMLIHNLKILKMRTHSSNILTYYDIKINIYINFAVYNCTYVLYRLQGFGEITYSTIDQIRREASRELYHRIWHFLPNERIRIRTIFHNLKIHDRYRSCHQNITVCTLDSTKYRSNNENLCKDGALVFCGDYSLFYFYAQHNEVYFSLFCGTNPYLKIDVTFDIISNNIVHNYNLQPKDEIKYQTFYNIQIIQILVQVFYIKVSKFQQINMKFNLSLTCTIYDGPGYLSMAYIISDKYSNFVTSSFQCSIKVISNTFQAEMHNSVLTYSSCTKHTKTLIFGEQQQKYYTHNSFKNESTFHEKLIFESGNHTHFNIKIIEFSYIALFEDLNCKYGGVSMFDFILGDMEETRSDGTSRLDDQFNLQPFNSRNNKTGVVIYSYYQYSNISIYINISVIDCHLLKINLCDMTQVCQASAKSCSTYLQNEIINIHGERISMFNSKITFQPKGEHCVQVQLETNPFSFPGPFPNFLYFCDTKFYVKVSTDSYVYQYDISGYLSNIDYNSGHFQKFHAYNTPYKYDPMHDMSASYWANGTKKLFKHVSAGDEYGFISLNAYKHCNVAFKASFLEKMPSHKDSVWFYILLTKWISWVDLHFRKTNILPENENKIMLSTSNHFANNILEQKILKLSMNLEDIKENHTEFQLTIRTQVKDIQIMLSVVIMML